MKLIALMVWCVLPASGVVISDTLRLPDGTLANGRLTISLVTNTSSSSVTYLGFRKTITVTAGVVSVDLPANTALTPAGTIYRVDYSIAGGATDNRPEYWAIPAGGPFTIREVRASAAPLPNGLIAHSQISPINALKGDLLAFSGSLATGWQLLHSNAATDGYCLKKDSTATLGWSIQSCGSGGAGGGSYSQPFASQTTVVLTHNLGTLNISEPACYDGSGNYVEWNTFATTSTTTATVTFTVAQTGSCTIALGGGGSSTRFASTFSSSTTVTILGTAHGLGSADLHVQCRDSASPRKLVEPNEITIDDSTFNVVITFTVAQAGRCALI